MASIKKDSFDWDRSTQIDILVMLRLDRKFMLEMKSYIKPSYFCDKVLQWFFLEIVSHFEQYDESPSTDALHTLLREALNSGRVKQDDFQSYREVLERLKNPPKDAAQFTTERVTQFCQTQEMVRLTLDWSSKLKDPSRDDLDEFVTALVQAKNIGNLHRELGCDVLKNYKDRAHEYANPDALKVIPTGLTGFGIGKIQAGDKEQKVLVPRSLDSYLDGGGIEAGKLGIFVGASGAGKSQCLVQIGLNAAIRGFRVFHVTLELSKKIIVKRYDTNISRIALGDLRDSEAEFVKQFEYFIDEKRVGSELYKHYNDLENIKVEHYPTGTLSVQDLKAAIQQLELRDWRPDLVIVDYIDIMKHTSKYSQTYENVQDTAYGMTGLAQELDIPIWTVCQFNREGMGDENPGAHNIQGSVGKIYTADFVGTFTKLEGGIKNPQIDRPLIRMTVDKNRMGADKMTFYFCHDFARSTFSDPEAAAKLLQEHGVPQQATRRRPVQGS